MEQHTLLQREESPRSPAAPSLRRLGGSRHITHWDPEDLGAWEAGNKGIARRNLLWSVVTVHLGYSVWTLWPVLELLMPQDVYGFSTSDKFLLGTIATLFGAFLRMPYALASAIFGGRNWATFSAIVLLIPAIGTTVLLTHPGLPLWPYLVCAALTGLGGGNFASSMSNANAFYPHRLKGSALGIAGGVGNLGVPAIQLVGLLAIATVGERKPYLVCALYVVLVAIAVIGVSLFMNNVEQHRVQVNRLRPIVSAVLSTRDTWLLSLSTSALSAHSSASPSCLARCCRPTSWRADKARRARRCMPSSWRLSGRCWRRWPGFTVAGWPIESVEAA